MTRDELRRLIRGPICTLPTALDEGYQLDLGTMAERVRWLVANGITKDTAPLKVCAAMGEGPDLTDDEWPHLLRTVVRAADGKAAVVCGLRPKDTLHTIEDAKQAADLGAVGLQIDLPMFHHPNQDDYVRFFSEISDAIPIGIMVYNTYWFGAPPITPETMLRLKDAEHVVAIKWATPDGMDYDEMRRFATHFNVIDNSGQPARCYRNGGCGFIDYTPALYPAHVLKIEARLRSGQYDAAQALFDEVNGALGQFNRKLHQRSGGYRMEKGLGVVLGRSFGPPRKPTLPLDADELAELRGIVQGFGWL